MSEYQSQTYQSTAFATDSRTQSNHPANEGTVYIDRSLPARLVGFEIPVFEWLWLYCFLECHRLRFLGNCFPTMPIGTSPLLVNIVPKYSSHFTNKILTSWHMLLKIDIQYTYATSMYPISWINQKTNQHHKSTKTTRQSLVIYWKKNIWIQTMI